MVCTSFGHRECYGLDAVALSRAVEELIHQGVEVFYVGHQGQFDSLVYTCLTQLRLQYPHIRCRVVLAYLPTEAGRGEAFSDTVFPEGVESVPPRFAVEFRNNWMIHRSQYCLCYIQHTWGGAYKFAKRAKRRGLTVVNLGKVEI